MPEYGLDCLTCADFARLRLGCKLAGRVCLARTSINHHRRGPGYGIVQQDYAWGPTVALGGGAVSYERGSPVLTGRAWQAAGAVPITSRSAPESRIPNPDSQIQNPKSRIPNPESQIPNPQSPIPNPESLPPRPYTMHPTPETRHPKPGTRNPKPVSNENLHVSLVQSHAFSLTP